MSKVNQNSNCNFFAKKWLIEGKCVAEFENPTHFVLATCDVGMTSQRPEF